MQPDTFTKAWSCGVGRAREEDGWSPVEARDFLVSHGHWFWRNLIEFVQADEPIDLEITNDAARSRPRF
jgi:hypothetical protein